MGETKIEWADRTWNAITGCSPISEGCANCYAKRMATRLAGRCGYPKDDPFRVAFHRDRVKEPLKWKRPQRVFVCSMSDLFHDSVSHWWLDDIFDTMIHANQHTYMLLTKRPQNVMPFLSAATPDQRKFMRERAWLGVTAENQRRADERISVLMKIPAAVRFVSLEPLLEGVSPSPLVPCPRCTPTHYEFATKWLDWVIVGPETGPNRRPCKLEWIESIIEECREVSIPCFVKAIPLNGRISKNMDEWPEHLRVRQFPNVG